ncbi:MAG: DUF2478 domain-containing protein [Polyangiaceae bacterium]|nr:DUF2478 domain-containing protein [Polyangiaceae bacterium]
MAPRWALLAVARGSGKTALAAEVAHALVARGVRVAGVLQEPVLGEDGARVGYRVVRIGQGESLRLARLGAEPGAGEESFCSFLFDGEAFARAGAWLRADAPRADVVFVDEVSKLEVAGRGHHDAVVALLVGPALPLLAVRADQLFAVMERFGLGEPEAACEGTDPEALDAFAAALVASVRGRSDAG